MQETSTIIDIAYNDQHAEKSKKSYALRLNLKGGGRDRT